MAVTVQDHNSRLDDADALTNWTKITAATAQEGDFVWQGSYSVSGKIGTSSAGHYLTPAGGSTDMTVAGDKVVMFKAIWTTKDILEAVPAAVHRVGSSSSAYYEYYVADNGTRGNIDYPVKGGWLITPIDPNEAAWRDDVSGSPSLSAANYFATLGRFTTTSKSENMATDAVDIGDGLWIYGSSPDATWQDFIDDDEGTQVAGRFGHVTTLEEVIFLYGTFWIGRDNTATSQATTFNDSLKSIIFPGGRVADGWNSISIDLGSGSTDIDFANSSHCGRGRTELKRFFDTEFEVDGTNEEVDITAHGFVTGEYVIYSNQGGTETIGLTSGNGYYVQAVTANSISFHTTRNDAFNNASRVGLTASSSGNAEEHSLTRDPDTRPDLYVTGTSGDFLASGCVFVRFRNFTFTSACELDGCTIVESQYLDLNGGTLTTCVLNAPTVARGEAFVLASTTQNITDTAFISGDEGHAIEIDTPGSYSWVGNTVSGYWTGDDDNTGGVAFNPSTDIDDGNDEIDITGHPFTSGDCVYYSDEGGTTVTGLTDDGKYYVRSVTVDSISLHETEYGALNNQNKVAIATGSNETHKLYSANAALYNSSGGAVTINVSGGGGAPSVRNKSGSTTTVNSTVVLKLTVKDVNQVAIENAQCYIEAAAGGPETEGTILMNEDTLATGVAQEDYDYGTEQPIRVRVRKSSSGATKYIPFSTTGTIDGNGYTLDVTLREDEVVT